MINPLPDLLAAAALARREGRSHDALVQLEQALPLARADGAMLPPVLKALGQVERDLGNLAAAVRYYEEAAALCRGDADQLVLAHTVRHLGDVLFEAGDLARAEACLAEALQIYRGQAQGASLDLANASRSMALLREARGDKHAAHGLWEAALGFYDAAGVMAGVEECRNRLGIH